MCGAAGMCGMAGVWGAIGVLGALGVWGGMGVLGAMGVWGAIGVCWKIGAWGMVGVCRAVGTWGMAGADGAAGSTVASDLGNPKKRFGISLSILTFCCSLPVWRWRAMKSGATTLRGKSSTVASWGDVN